MICLFILVIFRDGIRSPMAMGGKPDSRDQTSRISEKAEDGRRDFLGLRPEDALDIIRVTRFND